MAVSHRTVARCLVALALVVCAVGMLGPFQGIEKRFITADKAAHFAAFYGLTFLLILAFPGRRRTDLAVLALFVGAGLEVAQLATGRSANVLDLIADGLGVLAVIAPMWLDRYVHPPKVERRQGRRDPAGAAARRSPAALSLDP